MSRAQVRVVTAQSRIRKGDSNITNLRVGEKWGELVSGEPISFQRLAAVHSLIPTVPSPGLQSHWASAAGVQLLYTLLFKSHGLCCLSSPHARVPPGT